MQRPFIVFFVLLVGALCSLGSLAAGEARGAAESTHGAPAPSAGVTTSPAVLWRPPSVADAVRPAPATVAARDLLDRMNDARLRAGLAPLVRDARLEEVAAARAANLVQFGYFDHFGPGGESAFTELAARRVAYQLAGENLARNSYPTADSLRVAFDGLMASPTHRANIMEPVFTKAGVVAVRQGAWALYVTVFKD
jgi:uncharacterized protein YkwD